MEERDEDRLRRIEDKLDKLTDKLHETNIILAENTQSLIIHEKRTDIAEKKLELLEQDFKDHAKADEEILDKIEAKLTPVYNHVEFMKSSVIFTLKYIIPSVLAVVTFLFKLDILK